LTSNKFCLLRSRSEGTGNGMVRRENLRRVLIVGPLETPLPFQFRTHGAWGEPTTGIFVKSFLMIYS